MAMEIFPIKPVGASSFRVQESNTQTDVRLSDLEPKKLVSRETEVFEEALSVFASMTPRRSDAMAWHVMAMPHGGMGEICHDIWYSSATNGMTV